MKSINIEILMGHSVGISDSYYKITEEELLPEYLKAVNHFITAMKINYKSNSEKMTEKSERTKLRKRKF